MCLVRWRPCWSSARAADRYRSTTAPCAGTPGFRFEPLADAAIKGSSRQPRYQALFLPRVMPASRIAWAVIAAIENLRPGSGGASPAARRRWFARHRSAAAAAPAVSLATRRVSVPPYRAAETARSETFASRSYKRDPCGWDIPGPFCANNRTSKRPLRDAPAAGFERRAVSRHGNRRGAGDTAGAVNSQALLSRRVDGPHSGALHRKCNRSISSRRQTVCASLGHT